jgi:hypothetical protein
MVYTCTEDSVNLWNISSHHLLIHTEALILNIEQAAYPNVSHLTHLL